MFTARPQLGIWSIAILSALLAVAEPVEAQQTTIEEATAELAKKLEQVSAPGSKIVLLIPFSLSPEIQKRLEQRASDFQLVGSAAVERLIQEEYIQPRDLNDPKAATWLARKLHAMYVVVGEAKGKSEYVELNLQLFKADPERRIAEIKARIERQPEVVRLLMEHEARITAASAQAPGSQDNPDADGIFRAGRGDVSVPRCKFCPNPTFSDPAVPARLEGTVVMRVVVGVDGSILRVTPVRGAPFGLTRQAVDIVRTWKLEPAKKDGIAVPAHLLVEVVFRQH